MEAHNFLTSGWVQQPRSKVLRDRNVVIVGKPDGQVLLAHCTCMAGLGEACSHIGAILIYLEVVVKRRDEQTCTEDKTNAWLPPQLQTLEGTPVVKIDFASSKIKKGRLNGEDRVATKV
ncbi:unnamed protein product [Ixodes hexagonus]